ncbi:hypothetical protein [Cohnella silvisoli]|uniref:DUF4367 domain-containing protein n=1 Tax=Cohnella silvisoli TaxID=2873699 RepID=A0ABV1KMS0_9BACL|nr:hypothetical protein [Cohnella silvisoli]MCD9020347.1 hypothetical protein [Cohnella silvisoli]
MQIEKQLAEAYKLTALEIKSPLEVDAHIVLMYEKQMKKERGNAMRPTRKKVLQIALIGLLVLVITGFTAQYLNKLGDERFSMEFFGSDQRKYDEATASVVRGQMQQIQSQLKVGESAIVYSHEIEEITPTSKNIPYAEYVSNPYVYTDFKAWKTKLRQHVQPYKLPAEGINGLTFVGGEEEMPFGGVITQLEVIRELHSEVNDEGKEIAWRKIEPDKEAFPVFTSVYKYDNQDEVKVSMQIISQKIKVVGPGRALQEKVTLNGQEALYTFNKKFLYSDTNQYQSLDWVETLPDISIVYSIGSSAKSMTKEKLISIGESLVTE